MSVPESLYAEPHALQSWEYVRGQASIVKGEEFDVDEEAKKQLVDELGWCEVIRDKSHDI